MLIDPDTGLLTAVASRALRAHDDRAARGPYLGVEETPVEEELFLQQIETQTPPRVRLDDLARDLQRGRQAVCEAAEAAGAAAVATAAPVLIDTESEVTNKPRYRRIREKYGEIARSSLACAMHVHVDVADPEEGVRVLDGIGPWLPVLIGIGANSPYAYGRDTGYASWRTQIWTRWPSHGTGEPFGDHQTYRAVAEHLIEWGAGLDDGMVYFDARLPVRYPTVEIRVADVATDLDDAVLVAGLARALVTVVAEGAAGTATAGWRSDLLRAAGWRASRYGVADRLVEPATMALVPARAAIEALVALTRPALEQAGDLDLVVDLVERLLARGNGAIQQRRTFEATGSLEAVVDDVRQRTEDSWREHGTWLAG